MSVENPHSFWPTPPEAVLPLLPHLKPETWFVEPCAGDGALVRALCAHGHKLHWAADIEPRQDFILPMDALSPEVQRHIRNTDFDAIITNPPFSRHNFETLKAMIRLFSAAKPSWLLLPAAFKYNDYAPEFMAYCHKVVAVGRIQWIAGSDGKGRKDFAWYLFDQNVKFEGTKFYPKLPPPSVTAAPCHLPQGEGEMASA